MRHPHYEDNISESFVEYIFLVTPLHDIYKVVIPDDVLMKQGKLTNAEFEIMTQHTVLGAHELEQVLEYCDFKLFHMARRVILSHHEQ
jgi:putative two-component system response regulator